MRVPAPHRDTAGGHIARLHPVIILFLIGVFALTVFGISFEDLAVFITVVFGLAGGLFVAFWIYWTYQDHVEGQKEIACQRCRKRFKKRDSFKLDPDSGDKRLLFWSEGPYCSETCWRSWQESYYSNAPQPCKECASMFRPPRRKRKMGPRPVSDECCASNANCVDAAVLALQDARPFGYRSSTEIERYNAALADLNARASGTRG